MRAADEQIASDLAAAIGARACLTDPDQVASFTTDWTRRFGGSAVAVVRPSTIADVIAVLAVARRHGAAIIPQGGNTGLVGGSVPRQATDGATLGRPQIVLSTLRLDAVEPVDPGSRLLLAGGGATLASAQRSAAAAGCHLGIDFAARDSATLGGMVATNAGGMQVFRYGAMRARLAGLEAVLADGTVVSHLSGLVKDNVGWEPAALLSGSEGTLGVITRVMVRLEPRMRYRVAAVVAVRDIQSAVDLVDGPLRALPSLEAAELTLPDGMALVGDLHRLAPPPGGSEQPGAWLTLEAAAHGADPTDALAAALDDPRVIDAAVGSDDATRTRLWSYRELHTEAVSRLGVPHKLDVAVVPTRLPELLTELPRLLARVSPSSRCIVWGHVADGNVHVNVIGPSPEDDTVDEAILRLVVDLGGAISAEHGIGVAKRRFMHLARTAGTLDLMARVKAALDPAGTLNPGVLEPAP